MHRSYLQLKVSVGKEPSGETQEHHKQGERTARAAVVHACLCVSAFRSAARGGFWITLTREDARNRPPGKPRRAVFSCQQYMHHGVLFGLRIFGPYKDDPAAREPVPKTGGMTVRLCPSLRAPPPGERAGALTTPQREHHEGGPLRGRSRGWQLRQRSRPASVDEPVRFRPSPPGSRPGIRSQAVLVQSAEEAVVQGSTPWWPTGR